MKKIFFLFSFLFFLGMGNLSAQWLQIGSDIDGEAAQDRSGQSVTLSADGKRIAIGAYLNDGNGTGSGQVRVYSESGGVWSQLGSDINGEAAMDQSGYSVSLSADGKRLAIGANTNHGTGSFSGHVRVYSENGSVWSQLGSDIDGEAAFDRSGTSVSMSADGKRLAIGAPGNAGTGHVRVYSESGGIWTQLGIDINGEAVGDQSGFSVSLSADGKRLAIGAYGNDGNGSLSGHVRVYSESGGVWSQLGSDMDGEAGGDYSGWSVSLSADGKRLAIGAPYNLFNQSTGAGAGHVRVYLESGGVWTQLGSDIEGEGNYEDGETAFDQSGFSVSLSADGKRLAIGSPGNEGNSDAWTGNVRVYSESGSIWLQLGNDIDGEGEYDESGSAVSLSADGTRLGVGAPENGTDFFFGIYGAGHVRVYDFYGAICPDADLDGFTNSDCGGTDCADNDAYVNPGATEICNNIDDDCDGLIDDEDSLIAGQTTWYEDTDGDVFGDPAVTVSSCEQPTGFVGTGTDCNDSNGSIYPEAPEISDNLDNDCDGLIDEGLAILNVDAGDCEMVLYGYAPEACTTLTVNAINGTQPYSYLWSNGGTTTSITVCPDETSIYSVTVTDANGQSAEDNVTVQVINVSCGNNNNKVLVCHIPPGQPENAQVICITPSAIPDHIAHGCYVGICDAPDPCEGSNQSLVTEQVASESDASRYPFQHAFINNHEDEASFMVMPNPANNHIEVHTNLFPAVVSIMDISGKVVLQQVVSDYNTVNTSSLMNGIYFIRLQNGNGCYSKSIVVIH